MIITRLARESVHNNGSASFHHATPKNVGRLCRRLTTFVEYTSIKLVLIYSIFIASQLTVIEVKFFQYSPFLRLKSRRKTKKFVLVQAVKTHRGSRLIDPHINIGTGWR